MLALLVPLVPARLKEWAYAGFAINLVSALIAHFSVGDGLFAWGWAASPACSEKDRAQFPSDAAGKRTAAKSRNPLVNGARALGKIHFRPMYAVANMD